MADTPLGGSQVSETASEPGIKSPEHSMSPESVTDSTPTTQPKSQPPKRRGKGKAYTQCILNVVHVHCKIIRLWMSIATARLYFLIVRSFHNLVRIFLKLRAKRRR